MGHNIDNDGGKGHPQSRGEHTMQTTKLALHTIKNNDSMFDVEITENVLDAERISYVVLFNDVLATNAYDETFYVSFRTAEEADKYVQEYVDNNGMKFVDIDNDTIISTKHYTGIDGMEHDIELHRFQDIVNSRFMSILAIMYEVHIYTNRDDGEICSKYRYKTFDAALKAYKLYSGEKRMN